MNTRAFLDSINDKNVTLSIISKKNFKTWSSNKKNKEAIIKLEDNWKFKITFYENTFWHILRR